MYTKCSQPSFILFSSIASHYFCYCNDESTEIKKNKFSDLIKIRKTDQKIAWYSLFFPPNSGVHITESLKSAGDSLTVSGYTQFHWEYLQRGVIPGVDVWKQLVGECVCEGVYDCVGIWVPEG